MDEQPEPDGWPEGLWLAQQYASTYQIPMQAAVDLVYGGHPAGGWVSGACQDPPPHDPGS